MKTIEELMVMTKEELITLVQELQEDNEKQTKSSSYWYNEAKNLKEKYSKSKSTIKALAEMIQ